MWSISIWSSDLICDQIAAGVIDQLCTDPSNWVPLLQRSLPAKPLPHSLNQSLAVTRLLLSHSNTNKMWHAETCSLPMCIFVQLVVASPMRRCQEGGLWSLSMCFFIWYFYEKLRLHLTHCFSFSIQQPMMPKGKSSTATAIAARKLVIQKKCIKIFVTYQI